MFPFFLQMSILFCFFAEKEIIVNYYGLSKADFWVSYIAFNKNKDTKQKMENIRKHALEYIENSLKYEE